MKLKTEDSKLLALCLLALIITIAASAFAATKGDGTPAAKSGISQVAGYDAGTGAPICLAMNNQNSIMIRSYNRDGGTEATLFCGFSTSVDTTGMPLLAKEALTIDVVSVVQGSVPVPYDGGVSVLSPKLCCIGAPGAAVTDLRWMTVK